MSTVRRWIPAVVAILALLSSCGVTLGSQGAADRARRDLAPKQENAAVPPGGSRSSSDETTTTEPLDRIEAGRIVQLEDGRLALVVGTVTLAPSNDPSSVVLPAGTELEFVDGSSSTLGAETDASLPNRVTPVTQPPPTVPVPDLQTTTTLFAPRTPVCGAVNQLFRAYQAILRDAGNVNTYRFNGVAFRDALATLIPLLSGDAQAAGQELLPRVQQFVQLTGESNDASILATALYNLVAEVLPLVENRMMPAFPECMPG